MSNQYSTRANFTTDPRLDLGLTGVTSRFHPRHEVPQAMRCIENLHPHIYKFIVTSVDNPQALYDKLNFMLQVDTEDRLGFSFDAANALMVISMHIAANHDVKIKSNQELKKLFKRDRW